MRELELAKNVYGKKRLFILSLGYWFGAHSLGLVLHPYVSMRRMVRERVFVPLVLLPSVSLLFWWGLAFLISRLDVLVKLGFGGVSGWLSVWTGTQVVLGFVYLWGCVLCVFWQGLLGYLFFRFNRLRK